MNRLSSQQRKAAAEEVKKFMELEFQFLNNPEDHPQYANFVGFFTLGAEWMMDMMAGKKK